MRRMRGATVGRGRGVGTRGAAGSVEVSSREKKRARTRSRSLPTLAAQRQHLRAQHHQSMEPKSTMTATPSPTLPPFSPQEQKEAKRITKEQARTVPTITPIRTQARRPLLLRASSAVRSSPPPTSTTLPSGAVAHLREGHLLLQRIRETRRGWSSRSCSSTSRVSSSDCPFSSATFFGSLLFFAHSLPVTDEFSPSVPLSLLSTTRSSPVSPQPRRVVPNSLPRRRSTSSSETSEASLPHRARLT